MTDTHDGLDDYARSLTQRLLRASEQAPTRSLEAREDSLPRALAVLLATVVLVAGLIFVGASVLHIQFSRQPTKTPTPPPLVSVSPSLRPTPTATAEPSPTPVPANSITNLRMFTSTTGWAQRQSDGAILHTTNGVARWVVASPPIGDANVLAAAFVDGQHAEVLSATIPAIESVSTATIHAWATDNGGATWTRVGSFVGIATPVPDGSLDFVDREHGWFSVTGLDAAGSSAMYVYRTVDGGARWTTVVQTAFQVNTEPAHSIPLGCDKNPASFINASTGWVTAQCDGGPSFFYVTHDGGVTWTTQPLGVAVSPDGYTTEPPQFVSGSDGFMLGYVGEVPGPSASVFVTVDGGASWTRRLLPGTSSTGSEFLDPNNGWVLLPGVFNEAAPSAADLWVTHDAGRTWTHLESNVNVGGLDLDFLTNQIGWAFTALPAPSPPAIGFLQTTDGGRTWTVVTPTIAG